MNVLLVVGDQDTYHEDDSEIVSSPIWVADILRDEGLTGLFVVQARRAEILREQRRHDVIQALRQHEVGLHGRDVHPVLPEVVEGLGWDQGVEALLSVEARELLIERIAALADYAHAHGVVMAMKAHALGCVSRPYQLVDLFEQIGSPAFRFCFDISHYEVQGLSLEQALYPLLALSAHTEVKASIGRAPDQEYMIPGEPNTQSDFRGQFSAMRALGYRGYIVPEMSVHVMRRPDYDPYAALRLSHRALTDVLRDVGIEDS